MSKKKTLLSKNGGSKKNPILPVIPPEEEIQLEAALRRDREFMESIFDFHDAPILCSVPIVGLRVKRGLTLQKFLRKQQEENEKAMREVDELVANSRLLPSNTQFERQRQNAQC
jgi:hypothetical protein